MGAMGTVAEIREGNRCSFDDWEQEKLWEVFGSIPVNGDGGIQEGTGRNFS